MKKTKVPVLFRLLGKLSDRWEAILLISLASIVSNSLSLVIPLYFMQIYDRIIPNSSTETLIVLTVGAVTIVILDCVIVIGRGRLLNWYASKFSFTEGVSLMKKIFRLTNNEYQDKAISQYFESFRSIDRLNKIYSGRLFQTLMDIPFIFIFLFSIYYISGRLVYFHLIVIFVFVIFNIIFNATLVKYKNRVVEDNNKRFDLLRNVLNLIHPLKAMGLEEMLLRKLEIVQADYSRSYLIVNRKNNLPNTVSEITTQLMIYGTIVIGGILVFNGELSLGIIGAATMLARRTISPLAGVSKLSMTITEAKINLDRLIIVEKDKKNNVQDNLILPDKLDGLLELRDVTLNKNDGESGNLDSISLSADKGSSVGIIPMDVIASNLLVDTIVGIEKPQSGEILIDSMKLDNMDTIVNLPGIAVIPPRPELFAGSVIENITLFKPELTIQALDTAAFLGLNPLVAKLPKGYETELSSISEKTLPSSLILRIAVARAFVTRPRIIISNRIDMSMNEETSNMYFKLLDELKGNTTIILISENLKNVEKMDSLYILNESKLNLLVGADL